MTCPVADLIAFAEVLLNAVGAPSVHARLTAEILVAADVEGLASHGLMLLPMYIERIQGGSVVPSSTGRVVSDGGTAVVIDAENGLGQVTSQAAIRLAIERAGEHGQATIAVRNGFHFGAAGFWARKLALSGHVGIAMSNTRPLMPAAGGSERLVGNNPIAIAVPAEPEPIVFDMATSATAMGKIRMAAAAGAPLPEGWAADASGEPTTDADAAIAGMLLPTGGAKGFGLALMIDLLAGGLSGGAIGEQVQPLYGDASIPYRCAHLFIALRVSAFQPLDQFKSAVSAAANRIRSSRARAEGENIRVPGDRAAVLRKRNESACEIAASTAAALRKAAAALRVTVPPCLQN